MFGVGASAPELLLLFIRLLTLTGGTHGHENGPAVVKVVVKEGSAAILPCSLSTKENIESKLFDWKKDGPKEVFIYDAGIRYNNGRPGQDEQFKGRVSHFQDELKHGNASIKITNTKVTDSGNYICIFPRLQPERKIFHIQLVVEHMFKDRSGEITGAAPEPYITIVNQTEDRALLQCVVRGASPKPQLQWQDSAGNILPAEETQVSERGSSYYVTLQANVTKADRFSCVVTQEDINHQTHAETYVYINGAAPEPYITTLNATEGGVLLQCEVRGASPKPQLQWRDSAGNVLPAEEPQVSYRGDRCYVTLQTTVTKTDHFSCVVTQEDIKHVIAAETFVPFGEKVCEDSSSKVITGWLGGLVLGALVLAAVLALLVAAKCITIGRYKGRYKGSREQRNGSCNGQSAPLNSPV